MTLNPTLSRIQVHALQLAYRLPAVWMFKAFGAEFEEHAYGLHARDFACFDGLHPNHDARAETMVSDLVWKVLRGGLHRAGRLAAGRPTAHASSRRRFRHARSHSSTAGE